MNATKLPRLCLALAAALSMMPALVSTGCAGAPSGATASAWTTDFDPPAGLDTERMHLEVLRPEVAELDYRAFMSSVDHLQRTLHWGSWPSEDMTVEDNAKDLVRHAREFEAREAYAYTVLAPDGSECLGCLYMNPAEDDPRTVRVAYWVVEKELTSDLDRHLIDTTASWIESDWPLDTIVMKLHVDNERGIRIAQELGFELAPETVDAHRELRWQR